MNVDIIASYRSDARDATMSCIALRDIGSMVE